MRFTTLVTTFLLSLSLILSGLCLTTNAQSSSKDIAPQSNKPDQEERWSSVSKEVTAFYQNTNAALFMSVIDPSKFNGPHVGPGFVTAREGSTFTIEWFDSKTGKDDKPRPMRIIGLSSIISIDRPLTDQLSNRYVIYYKGPSGETEMAILIMEGEFAKSFIKRWQSFLLSSETAGRQ